MPSEVPKPIVTGSNEGQTAPAQIPATVQVSKPGALEVSLKNPTMPEGTTTDTAGSGGNHLQQPPLFPAAPAGPRTAITGSIEGQTVPVGLSATLRAYNPGAYTPVQGQRPFLRMSGDVPPGSQDAADWGSTHSGFSSLKSSNEEPPGPPNP